MKPTGFILIMGFLMLLIHLVSCESEDDIIEKSGFYIEISDGSVITEDDILYYDSSSCILFLKNPLFLSYKESESGNLLENWFTVFVNGDTIYKGVIYPFDYLTSAGPPFPFVIYRDINELDRSVLEIRYFGFSRDLRNDPGIISTLSNSGLLFSGISFTINSVGIFGLYYGDSVSCEITIHNPDPINYYILDPEKMGESYYNFYNGGLEFIIHTTGSVFDFDGIYHSEYGSISEADFSLLEAGGSRTFTFGSNDYYITFDGVYKCNLNLRYRSSVLDLNQPDGRIWIGKVSSGIDNIVVKFE